MATDHGPQDNSAVLRILLVEDNSDDAELCLLALNKAYNNSHLDVVQTPEEFASQLREKVYDIVLSDYALGGWTGVDAFTYLRTQGHDIPFILVTGALGEERAVECIKNGVTDYVLKDRLERLPITLVRALEEKRLREEHKRAEQSLLESEAKFRTLAEAIPAATFIEQGTHCYYVNHAAEEITGYTREELEEMTFWQLVHPDSRKSAVTQASKSDQPTSRHELKILTKDNEVRWLDVTVGMFQHDGALAALITAFDISERKHADEGLDHALGADALTGLQGKGRLADIFHAESKRSEGTGRTCAVLLLNVDTIGNVNETTGHRAGDHALRRVARVLSRCRASDTPARLQGGDFAVLLPETTAEGAHTLQLRIAARIDLETKGLALSCNFGTAVFPADGKTLDQLLNVAKQRLQDSKTKHNGRTLDNDKTVPISSPETRLI
jgi:diguanylate cyclase (GGDEF)-like protein/PAS domain S-box-containing protein